MIVDVRLTQEQKNAEPDFEKTLARFQRQYDDVAGDMREKFRLFLHEGSHAMYFRRLGVDVNFHGPHIKAGEDGKIDLVLGAVSPVSPVSACAWQWAAVYMAGFTVVERLTGTPDGEHVNRGRLENAWKKTGQVVPPSPRTRHSLTTDAGGGTTQVLATRSPLRGYRLI